MLAKKLPSGLVLNVSNSFTLDVQRSGPQIPFKTIVSITKSFLRPNQSLANKSATWLCPSCRTKHTGMPVAKCFCGKVESMLQNLTRLINKQAYPLMFMLCPTVVVTNVVEFQKNLPVRMPVYFPAIQDLVLDVLLWVHCATVFVVALRKALPKALVDFF